MRAYLRGRTGSLLYVNLFQRSFGIAFPVQLKAVYKRQPDFMVIQVLHTNLMFDRAVARPRLPFPGQPEFW